MIRSYQMRLKATRQQSHALGMLLPHLCDLYNAALQERKEAWTTHRKSIRYYDQQKELTELRAEAFAEFPLAAQRDPLRRVDRAFKAFFRRCKAGLKPGHPRFRSRQRYGSFSIDSENFRLTGDSVSIVKLGTFKLKTRCKVRGTPKVLHIKRIGNQWNAVVSCDLGAAPEKITVRNTVGIDVGLTHLATLSDGSTIKNPRWTKQEEDRLALANQSLARKRRGSRNRLKARERLRRVHQRIAGLRASYLDDVAAWLVANYDLIAHEKLEIQEMAEKDYAKSILDAAWRLLLWKLQCKAEEAGKWVIPVAPRGTTQRCSQCGEVVPKELHERTHSCPHCGLTLDRDHNAALNILRLGESLVEVGQNV